MDMTVPGCRLETAFPLEPGQSVQLRVHLDPKNPCALIWGWCDGPTMARRESNLSEWPKMIRSGSGFSWAMSKSGLGRPKAGVSLQCAWAINMSHVERREATRNLNTLMFCGMVGLLVGLVAATIVNYRKSEPESDRFSHAEDQGEAQSASQNNRLPKEYKASYPPSRS